VKRRRGHGRQRQRNRFKQPAFSFGMTVLPSRFLAPPTPEGAAIVAIPVRNEAARIGACLDALGEQHGSEELTVLLLLNGCTDGTVAVALAHGAAAPFRLVLRHAALAPDRSHAGEARGRAMDAAADLLEEEGWPQGLLLTTDADSQVAPDWLAATRAELRAGADVVAGWVEYDTDGMALLAPGLRARMAQEACYAALLAEMEALLDTVSCDQWPRHRMASGASLAVRLPFYRRVGGLPRVPVGEDRALLEALRSMDARIRHSCAVRVLTSCRILGRAAGGAADTLRRWAAEPDLPCDAALEPAGLAEFRWRMRAALRCLHAAGDAAGAVRWAQGLLVPPDFLQDLQHGTFGALWQMAEAASPLLRAQVLHPADLPSEILAARRILGGAVSRAAADPCGSDPYGTGSPSAEMALPR
jgi:hypothetical protein